MNKFVLGLLDIGGQKSDKNIFYNILNNDKQEIKFRKKTKDRHYKNETLEKINRSINLYEIVLIIGIIKDDQFEFFKLLENIHLLESLNEERERIIRNGNYYFDYKSITISEITNEIKKAIDIYLKHFLEEVKLDRNLTEKQRIVLENELKSELNKEKINRDNFQFDSNLEELQKMGEKNKLEVKRNKLISEIDELEQNKISLEKINLLTDKKNKDLELNIDDFENQKSKIKSDLEKSKEKEKDLKIFIEQALKQKESLEKEITKLNILSYQLKDKTNKLQQIDFGKDKELFEQKYNDQKKENDELKEEINKLKIQSKNNKKQPNDENEENTKTDSDPVQNILEKIGVNNIVKKLNEHKTETTFNIEDFKEYLKKKGLFYNDETIQDFHYSVLSNKLTILAGQPGCGKTRLMQEYIKFQNQELSTELLQHSYSFISVKPEWTDPSFLLGVPNYLTGELEVTEFQKICYLAEQCPNKQFYICLDEFNIARPENYFADFLSLRELKNGDEKKKIQIWSSQQTGDKPFEIILHNNIHFFTTINNDATTFDLSPKVLDRSNLIELKSELQVIKKIFEKFKDMNTLLNKEILFCKKIVVDFIKKWEDSSLSIFPLPVSYRSIYSILNLLVVNSEEHLQIIDYYFNRSILIKINPYNEMTDSEQFKTDLETLLVYFNNNKLINSANKIDKLIKGSSV